MIIYYKFGEFYMLEMIRGCNVNKCNELYEQYQSDENGFTANVNASKIGKLLEEFISMQSEKLFFILELPASAQREQELRTSNTFPFHKEVYYIDGLSNKKALELIRNYGEILIHDGLTEFGFGVHDGSSEIMCYKYNVVKIWTKDPNRYTPLFSKMDIPFAKHCTTAWETFNENNPGDSWALTINGMSAYDVLHELETWNIYLAEIR